MTLTLEAGFIAADSTLGQGMPQEARALLDNGTVLAFSYSAKVHIHGWSLYPDVSVAMPTESGDSIWLRTPEEILAAEARVPGLVYACFALSQKAHSAFYLKPALDVWEDNNSDDDGVMYATFTITKDGYTIGEQEPSHSMEDQFDDLVYALENPDEDTDGVEEFDTKRFISVVLPVAEAPSAHASLALLEQARRVLDQWKHVDKHWDEQELLPIVAPSADRIAQQIR